MNNEDLARRMAESLRELYRKMGILSDLTGWEIYDYFDNTGDFDDILVDLLGMFPDSTSRYVVSCYLDGEMSYEEMLALAEKSDCYSDKERVSNE